jgi:hypothetical protein
MLEARMAKLPDPIQVYLEIGDKRTFACAIDWPGWCRIGRDEGAALAALAGSAQRYAGVLHAAGLLFEPPADPSAFAVVERLRGNSTTDFGAPDAIPSLDTRPIADADVRRFQALLRAYWRAFDAAVAAASGKELRKGPRGGGRDVDGIVRHVLGAEQGYLARLARKVQRREGADLAEQLDLTRQAAIEALAAAARGELPERGPRGGTIWPPRYFVRRAGWHVLDHVWEIEDRIM